METEGYFRRNRSEDLGQILMNLYLSLTTFESLNIQVVAIPFGQGLAKWENLWEKII